MIEHSIKRRSPSPLVVAGIILVALGCLVGVVSPFVDNGLDFVMKFGGTFAFACCLWGTIRLIGSLTNPNHPPLQDPPEFDPPDSIPAAQSDSD